MRALFSLGLILIASSAWALDPQATVELHYRGALLSAAGGDAGDAVKEFRLTCLLRPAAAPARRLAWVLDEQGAGFHWPERFGQLDLDADNRPVGTARICALHHLDGAHHPFELGQPVFPFTDKLKQDEKWTSGMLGYAVVRSTRAQDRDCWEVHTASPFGPSEVMEIDKTDHLLVTLSRRMTLGQGKPFLLTLKLDKVQTLNDQDRDRVVKPLDALVALKEQLKRQEDETNPDLSDDQLKATASLFPARAADAQSTSLATLVDDIARDVRRQTDRSAGVTKLAEKFIGTEAPALALVALDGKAVDPAEFAGKITVLHFWSYHDDPLVEPYGQIGYLEFVHSRRHKLGVQVYGVAVDERLSNEARVQTSVRSIQKVIEFMNVSYPVTRDDGTLVDKFGDPRRLGKKLPLWVVVDPEGKIVHYHAGFYDIKPDEGLRALDEVLVSEIRKQKKKP